GTSLANHRTINRDHVEERTCRHVNELPKQILVHIDGIVRVPAKSFLQASVKRERISPQSKGGTQPEIEGIIGGIPINDGVGAGQRNSTARIAHLKEASHGGQSVQVKVESTSQPGLQG